VQRHVPQGDPGLLPENTTLSLLLFGKREASRFGWLAVGCCQLKGAASFTLLAFLVKKVKVHS